MCLVPYDILYCISWYLCLPISCIAFSKSIFHVLSYSYQWFEVLKVARKLHFTEMVLKWELGYAPYWIKSLTVCASPACPASPALFMLASDVTTLAKVLRSVVVSVEACETTAGFCTLSRRPSSKSLVFCMGYVGLLSAAMSNKSKQKQK